MKEKHSARSVQLAIGVSLFSTAIWAGPLYAVGESNGHNLNREASNRLSANKLASNKLASNKLASNKIASNRLSPNRIAAHGPGLNSVSAGGAPDSESPAANNGSSFGLEISGVRARAGKLVTVD